MTECEGCGIDTDIEGWLNYDEKGREVVIELCGFCISKVRKFIENSLP